MQSCNPNSNQEERKLNSSLTLLSIGIADEKDMSLRCLEEAKKCDVLYAELYTTLLETDIHKLSSLVGKPLKQITREGLEEDSYALLEEAEEKKIGVLVGGDCLSATTHISLLIEAHKRGIPTSVIHSSSILTAIAETGLSLYKFGRVVTLPMRNKGPLDSVFKCLEENLEYGLHTLVLLDIDTERDSYVTINQSISGLLKANDSETFLKDTLVVGIARLGWRKAILKAEKAGELIKYEFGPPPHVLIVPGKLHFLEEKALQVFCSCPSELLQKRRFYSKTDRLIEKYKTSCISVLKGLDKTIQQMTISKEKVEELIDHARRYLEDVEYHKKIQKSTALVSVSYAEGILDALRLLNLVEFDW